VASRGYRIGVDVGGTFTDFILVHGGRLTLDKHPTTPRDQSEGVLGGLRRLAARERVTLEALLGQTALIVHGTTTADNTMIEMSGATTGLITSEGHRDEIEIRRGYKEDIWDPALPPPTPICPRRRRYGVPERLDFEGQVVVPLDEDAVRRALRRMKKQGVDSLAVVLLFSFVNPVHERRVRELAAEELPGAMVSLSYEVMAAAPEFERTSTTLVNAYVGPRIGRYLGHLEERLRTAGFAGELLVMQSNGGVMPGGWVAQKAVAVMGSGPAGGTMGAVAVAQAAGITDFISVDMGGTSYDVSLVRGGAPEVKSGWNWHHRYLIGLPMVDVQSVGAGGGSIARVESGTLKVGPRSAGAEPGPVCYGRGGVEPTVTDANVVLGRVDPAWFAGGQMTLDVDAAHRAVGELAVELGLETTELAEGICDVINAKMAQAIRTLTVEKGIEPRDFALVAFGGAGAMHAAFLARELEIPEVIVPRFPGAFSAWGMLETEIRTDFSRAYFSPLSDLDDEGLASAVEAQEREAVEALAEEGIERDRGRIEHALDIRYVGQEYTLTIPLLSAAEPRRPSFHDDLARRFDEAHDQSFGHANPGAPVELVTLRSTGLGDLGRVQPQRLELVTGAAYEYEERPIVFGRHERSARIVRRDALVPGAVVDGPAVIVEATATTVVPPGSTLEMDDFGHLSISVEVES